MERRTGFLARVVTYPAFAYVMPFAAYVILLGTGAVLPMDYAASHALRAGIAAIALVAFSRRAVDLVPSRPLASTVVGAAVFAVWIAPDLAWPELREHWPFRNALTGEAVGSVPGVLRADPAFLLLRCAGTALLVPVIEELFWRGWLLRYLSARDFQSIPVGRWTPAAFWITAVLFAAEHGPYWDVGLLAGVAYNWWAAKTGRLSDCILAHAVTNACLAAYVIGAGRWEYWP